MDFQLFIKNYMANTRVTMSSAMINRDETAADAAAAEKERLKTAEACKNLPYCKDNQAKIDKNGITTCCYPHEKDLFTNVNQKSKKERNIENFGQNQKCKSRY